MRPKSAEGRKKGYLIYNLILLNNEPQTGRRPIKGDFMFLYNLFGNEPQSAEGR